MVKRDKRESSSTRKGTNKNTPPKKNQKTSNNKSKKSKNKDPTGPKTKKPKKAKIDDSQILVLKEEVVSEDEGNLQIDVNEEMEVEHVSEITETPNKDVLSKEMEEDLLKESDSDSTAQKKTLNEDDCMDEDRLLNPEETNAQEIKSQTTILENALSITDGEKDTTVRSQADSDAQKLVNKPEKTSEKIIVPFTALSSPNENLEKDENTLEKTPIITKKADSGDITGGADEVKVRKWPKRRTVWKTVTKAEDKKENIPIKKDLKVCSEGGARILAEKTTNIEKVLYFSYLI